MAKIGLDGLAAELQKTLSEFEELSYHAIREAVQKTADEVSKKTKGASPAETGVYKKNWKIKAEGVGGLATSATVYQNKKPSLTHLLQWGHGGPAPAKAYPHIVPDEETNEIFAENLRKEMER